MSATAGCQRRRRSGSPVALANLGAVLGILVARIPLCAAWSPGPAIECGRTNYNVGTVPLGMVLRHRFVLRNIGGGTLIIFSSTACCGTAVQLSTNFVAPGGSASLDARVGVTGPAGRFDRWVSLASNDPKRPRYVLRVTGRAIPPAQINPSIVFFEDVQRNSKAERELNIRPNFPLAITNAGSSQAEFQVALRRLPGTNGYRLSVTTAPPLPTGIISGQLALWTDDPLIGKISIAVLASVPGDLYATPSRIGLLAPGSGRRALTYRGEICSRSGHPFNVLRVASPSPDIRVSLAASGPGVWDFKVCASGTNMALPPGASIRFETDRNGERLELPIDVVK